MPHPSEFTLCREKWADMRPTDRGRVCARCARELVDFTSMSEDEIRAHHLRSPGTCGLYSLSQFHRPGSRLTAAAAAATIGLIGPTIALANTEPPPAAVPRAVSSPVDSVVMNGMVLDSATSRPISGALVVLLGTNLGVLTDQSGYFKLAVQRPLTLPLRLRAQSIGYASRDIQVTSSDSLPDLTFVLPQVMIGIVGIVVVAESEPPVPEVKLSIWRRIWRAIRPD